MPQKSVQLWLNFWYYQKKLVDLRSKLTFMENFKNEHDMYEKCVLCGEETNVLKTTHVDYRYGYVEGCGQCCKECYDKPNNIKKYDDDYVTHIMKNRTTLITVSAEDILNTPNDMELGSKVRQIYWNQHNETNRKYICELCGEDTSNVDYDYLSGTTHISCILANEMKL